MAPRAKSAQRRESTNASTAPMSSRGVTVPPEVAYKMSKKIAQLTKVIYYLNTKNEDHNVEVQSLIDAYESELSEAIKDGTLQIRDLQSKLEESNMRLQAHENVIQSYLETISSNETELKHAKETEETLRADMNELKRQYEDMEMKLSNNYERLERERNLAARSSETLRSNHDVEVKQMSGDFQVQLDTLREEHAKELKDLQMQNALNIKTYIDQYKQAQEQLKEAVSSMTKQNEDQIKMYQAENRELRDTYEAQIRGLTNSLNDTQSRLQQQVDELQASSADASRQVLELQEQAKIDFEKIRELDQLVAEKSGRLSTTQAELSTEKIRNKTLQQELDIMTERVRELTDRGTLLEQDVNSKTVLLAQNESTIRALKEANEKSQLENSTLTQSLDSAINTIRELNEKVHETNRAKAESDVLRIEKERAYRQLAEQMEEMERSLIEEREAALKKQEVDLREEFEEELRLKVVELENLRIRLLQRKDQEINGLEEKIKMLAIEAEERARIDQLKYEDEKAKLRVEIENLEEARNNIKEKMALTNKCLEDRIQEITSLLATIQQLKQSIKELEVDKADMFQKMVRIDDQIRGELNEKFRREKMELQEALERDHTLQLESQRDLLSLEHHREIVATVQQTEDDYKTRMTKLAEEQAILTEEWEKSKEEFEKKIASQADQLKIMMKSLLEMKESHSKKIADVLDSHQKQLDIEKKNWEFEISAKETQLKVSSTIAIGNLERKHKSALEEMEANHKKQLDDLRNQHTINTLALKKDAESQRLSEIAKLKAQHAEETENLNQQHVSEMAQTVLAMNMQRISDLKAANEANDEAISLKCDEISSLQQEIQDHMETEKELELRISDLLDEISALKDTLVEKCDAIVRVREEAENSLRLKEQELLLENEEYARKLNEEHIDEAQKMLTEFEKARAFLKKQIAAQAKQLQDADLKYINREPREIDLQRIADLEEDIKRRKRRIAAITEELEYCKLELNNREANFNKIFNKNPLVGVIEPLKSPPRKRGEPVQQNPKRLPPLYSPIPKMIETLRPAPPA